ncbi:ATP-binding protein [Actinomadura rugatobispora]|uniref:ATP-binding protein n=1 Tax=Actinomadura rugatobispora TaxID=1994 RepID=A0ABW0ZWD6_9ACTN|nr:helix-turn-helix transcriptional regulator [Actinomadura rugatobispora]
MESTLIGRDAPLRVLRSQIERAAASHGGLVLVTGEAGIGKTSLVGAAVGEATRRGVRVLHGACWDSDSTPGYWPWTQALRGLRRSLDDAGWARVAASAGGLLPALLGEDAKYEAVDGFRLFDAVTSVLIAASQDRPVLAVLEDLHWADAASLRLLEFAAQHIWFERLLVVATYRDVEVERPGHPLRPLFQPLVMRATTVRLAGLEPEGVAELMARITGERPLEQVLGETHLRTGGNPFYVEEAARLLSAGHPVTRISSGVRAALRRRVSLLSEPAADLLGAAAVLGRRFGPATLAGMVGASGTGVAGLLAEAVDADLVRTAPGGDLVFRHDLVRETLYDSLEERHTRRLHAAAVRALRDPAGVPDPERPTALARHAYLAAGELDEDVAVDLLLDAARHASARMACDEAVRHCERALERLAADAHGRRVRLFLFLGTELQFIGEHDRSWLAFERAAALAREAGDLELLGQVAMVLFSTDGQGDRTGLKSRVLRETHALPAGGAAPAGDAPGCEQELAGVVARRVVAAARESGDDEALRIGLWGRLVAEWGPDTVADRVALTGELVEVARRHGDRVMELVTMCVHWVTLLENGDPAYLEQLDAVARAARDSGSPRMGFASVMDRSVVCAAMGRFAEAEQLLAETLALTERDGKYFRLLALHHHWALALLQGRFDEADGVLRSLAAHGHPHIELLEAISALERGERPSKPVPRPARDADTVLQRSILPLWLRYESQAAAASGDAVRCERARADLAPYRGQWVVSFYGWSISGPASLWAGMLAAAQRRWDEAVDELTEARRSADRLHLRAWSVRARFELATVLNARGSGQDAATAAALLREVAAEAGRLGMAHLAERAEHMAPGPSRKGAADGSYEFTRDGSVWRLTYGGGTVHMPDAKGLRDLHCLLSQPGRDLAAVRLLNPQDATQAVETAASLGADAVLDDEAKARYRQRLARLDEAIEQATELGQDRRAAEYDREREALLDELRRATGLAGRARRLGDTGERARKTVTARIHNALRRIGDRHPDLAAHLRASVSTGATCRYAPDREIRWRL